MVFNWMIYFTARPGSCILNQHLWRNKYVQINKKTVYFERKKLYILKDFLNIILTL